MLVLGAYNNLNKNEQLVNELVALVVPRSLKLSGLSSERAENQAASIVSTILGNTMF